MSATVCPGCWTWYPAGTTRCKACRISLDGGTEVQPELVRTSAERTSSSVRAVRWCYAAQTLLNLGLLVAVIAGIADATAVYGVAGGHMAALTTGSHAALIAGAVAGAAIVLGMIWFVARWLLARMGLLLLTGGGLFIAGLLYVDNGLQLSQIAPPLLAAVAMQFVTVLALVYSIVRPEGALR